MKLKNIKVRYLFENDVVTNLNSHIIWEKDGLSFTIYKNSSKFVNVTGLKNLREIEQQKPLMEKLFAQQITSVKIDNIFFSKKDYKNIDMNSLYDYLKGNKNYFCNYNIELFVALTLHPKNKIYPTILLFRTGSYTLMGGKSMKNIYESESFVKELIDMFNKEKVCNKEKLDIS